MAPVPEIFTQLEHLNQSLQDAVWIWDVKKQRYLYFNKAATKVYGIDEATLIENPFTLLDRIHPDDLPEFERIIIRQIAGETTEQCLRIVHPDAVKWIRVRAFPHRNAEGEISTVAGISADITKEKLLELERGIAEEKSVEEREQLLLALDAERSLLKSILEHIPAGMMVVRVPDGEITLYNKKSEELLGHPVIPTNLTGYDQYRAYHPDGRPYKAEEYPSARALRGESVIDHELVYRQDNEQRVHLSVSASPVIDSNAEQIAAVLVFHDVSERKRLAEKLQAAKEEAIAASHAKSFFLANMSHEMRTPLAAIVGFAELLSLPENSEEDRCEFLSTIQKNAKTLTRLIDDILDLSKIEAGRLEVEHADVSLPELIEDLRKTFLNQAKSKGIELHLSIEDAVPRKVDSDPVRLRQILVNLIGNALKFTSAGEVELRVSRSAEQPHADRVAVDFFVRDTGIGLSDEQRKRIFQPFTQADVSITRRFGGTGLGLDLSRRLASALGGKLVLHESREHVGSTFRLSLPFSSPDLNCESKSKVPAAKAVRFDGLRVLIAEDSSENCLILKHILGRLGVELTFVDNGKDALDYACAHSYDMLLLDIQLPVRDGIDVARDLRSRGYKGPILAITAHAMAEYREKKS